MAKSNRKRSRKKLPTSCLFCGLVLANYRNLVDHIHTHTEERPYQCNYCDFAFRNGSIKIAHEKNIHLQIKHKCSKCKRIYNDRSTLRKHLHICDGIVVKKKVVRKLQTQKQIKRNNAKAKLIPRGVVPVANYKLKSKLKVTLKSIPASKSNAKNKSKPSSISVVKSNLLKHKPKQRPKLKPDLNSNQCEIRNCDIKPLTITEDVDRYPELSSAVFNGPPFLPPPLPVQRSKNDNKWDPMFFLHMNRYKEEDSMFSPNFQITFNNTQHTQNTQSPSTKSSKRVLKVEKQTVKKKSKNIRLTQIKTENKNAKVKREPMAAKNNATNSKENLTTINDSDDLKCRQCGKTFSHRGNLVRHAKIHDGDKPFMCRFCKKMFSEKSNLIRHLASMHQQEVQQDPTSNPSKTAKIKYSKKQLRCGFCGDTQFKNVRQICNHILSYHNALLYR